MRPFCKHAEPVNFYANICLSLVIQTSVSLLGDSKFVIYLGIHVVCSWLCLCIVYSWWL